jgi:L-alanine-DL-glutamate epimerase-like enolase superfamily enzyme
VKITAIETIPVRVPIQERLAIRAKGGYHAVSPFLLVRVHTDQGLHGWGEVSCTPRWSGEDQVTAAHFIRTIFTPLLENQDPLEIERLTLRMRHALAGHPFTKAALEMALWDILGKATGLPLYRLLGGPLREFVPTKWSVSGAEPERAAAIAAWAVEQGFRAMKVKVGIDPEQDIARVRAVRQAVGSLRLGVDANGAWNAATAVQMIGRLEEFGIAFAEQPVAPGDVEAMSEVRRSVRVPVIADESVYSAEDAFQLARGRAADVFSIYIGKGAGIGGARRVAAVAEAAGLRCTVGSNLEMGVGSAAMIHFAMATPGIGDDFPCDIIGPLFYTDELLQEPLAITGGQARPPERPGLGVELDDEKVRRYRVP